MTPYYAPKIENAPIRQHRATRVTGQIVLMVAVSALLVVGSIYAISLRAETVKDEYRVQQLVRLREQLEREQRQLELQRAYYRSPQVLEPLARRMGLVRPDSSRVIVADMDGGFRRWMPSLEVLKDSRRGVVPIQGRVGLRRPEKNHQGSLKPEAIGLRFVAVKEQTVSTSFKRPRRVETAHVNTTTRERTADAQTSVTVDEIPKARLGSGVLNARVEQVRQKVDKTMQRKRQ